MLVAAGGKKFLSDQRRPASTDVAQRRRRPSRHSRWSRLDLLRRPDAKRAGPPRALQPLGALTFSSTVCARDHQQPPLLFHVLESQTSHMCAVRTHIMSALQRTLIGAHNPPCSLAGCYQDALVHRPESACEMVLWCSCTSSRSVAAWRSAGQVHGLGVCVLVRCGGARTASYCV